MEIRELTESEVYTLIGPLAMDPLVLKDHDGYPIVTKPGWVWLAALESVGPKCLGFFVYSEKDGVVTVENSHTLKDYRKQGIYTKLWAEFEKHVVGKKVKLTASLMSRSFIEKNRGFTVVKQFKNWTVMERP